MGPILKNNSSQKGNWKMMLQYLQWQLRVSHQGNVVCKSPSCHKYHCTLNCLIAAPKNWETARQKHRASPWTSKGSVDTRRYLHTVRQTSWHCQPESVDVRSTPSCAGGENAMRWQWVQNRTKRKCLNLGHLFHHLLFQGNRALELFSFQNSFSPPPVPSLPELPLPIVSFQ